MLCIKTGFNLIRMSHMDALRGDLFAQGDTLVVVALDVTSRPIEQVCSPDKYTIIIEEGTDNGQVPGQPVYVLDPSQLRMTATMLATINEHLKLQHGLF